MHTCTHTCRHTHVHTHAHTHAHTHTHTRTQRIRIHVHKNDTFKATKDIAEGQELFIRYGGAQWFKSKNISVTNVDYASTMWRPDLHPLPCRRKVKQQNGADGRHNYTILEAVPSGTVLEISPCLEVSLIVVDQFHLWDFVITGEMENECRLSVANRFLPSHAHAPPCVFCSSRRRKYRRTC